MIFPYTELALDIEIIIGELDASWLWKLDAYNEGYQTGLAWTDSYKPGGPWVCSRKLCPKHPNSAEKNQIWLLGWQHGKNEGKA